MANTRRIKRLETLILQTVAPLISQGLSDPRLTMVTVTRIRLSPDMSIARVNWSCIGDEADRSKATHALDQARGYLQTEVGRTIRTRLTPRLEFHYDPALEGAVRVNAILSELARERAEREGTDEDADDETDVEGEGDETETETETEK